MQSTSSRAVSARRRCGPLLLLLLLLGVTVWSCCRAMGRFTSASSTAAAPTALGSSWMVTPSSHTLAALKVCCSKMAPPASRNRRRSTASRRLQQGLGGKHAQGLKACLISLSATPSCRSSSSSLHRLASWRLPMQGVQLCSCAACMPAASRHPALTWG